MEATFQQPPPEVIHFTVTASPIDSDTDDCHGPGWDTGSSEPGSNGGEGTSPLRTSVQNGPVVIAITESDSTPLSVISTSSGGKEVKTYFTDHLRVGHHVSNQTEKISADKARQEQLDLCRRHLRGMSDPATSSEKNCNSKLLDCDLSQKCLNQDTSHIAVEYIVAPVPQPKQGIGESSSENSVKPGIVKEKPEESDMSDTVTKNSSEVLKATSDSSSSNKQDGCKHGESVLSKGDSPGVSFSVKKCIKSGITNVTCRSVQEIEKEVPRYTETCSPLRESESLRKNSSQEMPKEECDKMEDVARKNSEPVVSNKDTSEPIPPSTVGTSHDVPKEKQVEISPPNNTDLQLEATNAKEIPPDSGLECRNLKLSEVDQKDQLGNGKLTDNNSQVVESSKTTAIISETLKNIVHEDSVMDSAVASSSENESNKPKVSKEVSGELHNSMEEVSKAMGDKIEPGKNDANSPDTSNFDSGISDQLKVVLLDHSYCAATPAEQSSPANDEELSQPVCNLSKTAAQTLSSRVDGHSTHIKDTTKPSVGLDDLDRENKSKPESAARSKTLAEDSNSMSAPGRDDSGTETGPSDNEMPDNTDVAFGSVFDRDSQPKPVKLFMNPNRFEQLKSSTNVKATTPKANVARKSTTQKKKILVKDSPKYPLPPSKYYSVWKSNQTSTKTDNSLAVIRNDKIVLNTASSDMIVVYSARQGSVTSFGSDNKARYTIAKSSSIPSSILNIQSVTANARVVSSVETSTRQKPPAPVPPPTKPIVIAPIDDSASPSDTLQSLRTILQRSPIASPVPPVRARVSLPPQEPVRIKTEPIDLGYSEQAEREALFVCDDCGSCFDSAVKLEEHSQVHSMGTDYGREVKPGAGTGAKRSRKKRTFKADYLGELKREPGLVKDSKYKHLPCVWAPGIKKKAPLPAEEPMSVPVKNGEVDIPLLTKRVRLDQQRKFPCPYCGKRFVSKINVKRHSDVLHLGISRFKCRICGRPTPCRSELARHESIHKDWEWAKLAASQGQHTALEQVAPC